MTLVFSFANCSTEQRYCMCACETAKCVASKSSVINLIWPRGIRGDIKVHKRTATDGY